MPIESCLRFARHSPLEEAGFELFVPPAGAGLFEGVLVPSSGKCRVAGAGRALRCAEGSAPAARLSGALIEEVRFAGDSALEEAVSSELVSEADFPASREFTENFIDWGLSRSVNASKTPADSKAYQPIPYASEQGIFCGLAGNLNR